VNTASHDDRDVFLFPEQEDDIITAISIPSPGGAVGAEFTPCSSKLADPMTKEDMQLEMMPREIIEQHNKSYVHPQNAHDGYW
jgi:hypothetical protein